MRKSNNDSKLTIGSTPEISNKKKKDIEKKGTKVR